MQVDVRPGRYVIAVSGGVDSMVLLNVLRQMPQVELVVAHYDHGIRLDAHLDRKLVQNYAKKHGLVYIYDEGRLGIGASEAVARDARYAFLRKVMAVTKARKIITAHHRDDVLETAVINLLRGTKRRGMSSLKSHGDMERPLLNTPKDELRKYAKDNQIIWREDSTNQDTKYLRNHVRHRLLNTLSNTDREVLSGHISRLGELNDEIDRLLVNHLHMQPAHDRLDRPAYIRLPHSIALEVMAAWLRHKMITSYDRRMLERLVVAAKTRAPGKRIDIVNGSQLHITHNHLALVSADR